MTSIIIIKTALKDGEASRIFTLVGGASPAFVLIFSVWFFQETFSTNQWLAIVFLILGTMVISKASAHHSVWFDVKHWLHFADDRKWISAGWAMIAALLFALFWIGTKFAYINQPFVSAFIWIRLGVFLIALILIINKDNRREIFQGLTKSNQKKQNKFIYFGTQAVGTIGAILQNYAVAIGSVALVTSLQGMQYAVLLVLSAIITAFYPKIIKESTSQLIVVHKIVAVVLIGLGLYFISL